jgi:RNA polymerase sigma-70 factor (ECF subfamily)
MVTARMDRRLAARIDPSDVVQEAMLEASRKLPEYLRTQPVPYYVWLRRIAWERLVHLHERHVAAQRRAVGREAVSRMELSDDSVVELAHLFVASESSPSAQLLRKELRQRVRNALESLSDQDRETLVLRYLEQLKVKEVASVLGISVTAATMRQLRALQRLRTLLVDFAGDDE